MYDLFIGLQIYKHECKKLKVEQTMSSKFVFYVFIIHSYDLNGKKIYLF